MSRRYYTGNMPNTKAPELSGWKHIYSGKVRDLYIPDAEDGEDDRILVVASDRLSAYDHILPTEIPDKGIILTQLTLWWFQQLQDLVENHLISTDVPVKVDGRAMICRRLEMYPLECVARGYLTGSGLAEYRETGKVCGISLPSGLTEASRLCNPIYTPAAKASVGEHDENITFEDSEQLVGSQNATQLRDLTLKIYGRAAELAADQGIILADTKFEFGQSKSCFASVNKTGKEPLKETKSGGQFILADEVLTPDSSRFWLAAQWQEGEVTPSFDKQIVRNWLVGADSGWNRQGPPPPLPPEVVEQTRNRYLQAFRRLTGRNLSV